MSQFPFFFKLFKILFRDKGNCDYAQKKHGLFKKILIPFLSKYAILFIANMQSVQDLTIEKQVGIYEQV